MPATVAFSPRETRRPLRNGLCPLDECGQCLRGTSAQPSADIRLTTRKSGCEHTFVHRVQRRSEVMSGRIAALVLVGTLLGGGIAAAQDSGAGVGPGVVEVTYMPAGAAFFPAKGNSPSFGNYGFGTAVTFNVNRFVGVEAELGSMIATTSDLQFGDLDTNIKSPNMLSYTGNVVVSPWTGHAVVPYGTAGIGGLTMFERPQLGVT